MKMLTFACAAILVAAFATTSPAATSAVEDLEKALALANKEGKMLFVQCGRHDNSDCQALREYIAAGRVPIPDSLFVYADVDIDNRETAQAFKKFFTVEGHALPFVVIADSDGKQLAARTGSGGPEEYQALLKHATNTAIKPTAPKKMSANKPDSKSAVTNAFVRP